MYHCTDTVYCTVGYRYGGTVPVLDLLVGRRGSRIQKGGFRTFRRGGGGFVQEFQERIQIVAGPWANQQAKKIADSRGGGGGDHPKKTLYPRMVGLDLCLYRYCRGVGRAELLGGVQAA